MGELESAATSREGLDDVVAARAIAQATVLNAERGDRTSVTSVPSSSVDTGGVISGPVRRSLLRLRSFLAIPTLIRVEGLQQSIIDESRRLREEIASVREATARLELQIVKLRSELDRESRDRIQGSR